MFSVEEWPEQAGRAWVVAQRFQKFLLVGAVGLGVNQVFLFVFHDVVGLVVWLASATAVFISMLVTFTLNERWTWHDRGKGKVVHRMAMYFPINLTGLVINVAVLTLLVNQFQMHYLIANLFGAGMAAVWNFVLNNHITWRD